MTNLRGRTRNNGGSLGKRIRQNADVYLLFLPTLLFYFVFKYIPMFGTVVAFQDYSLKKGIFGSEWVGFENFRAFLTNYKFFELMRNTLVISALQLIMGFPFPIILALLLNEVKNVRFKKTVQTITYMPHFLSSVVVVSILMTFVSSEGVINELRIIMGKDALPFMTTPKYFPWIYALSAVWQEVGWNSIIYVAAIAGVDQQLYEAASVDGAGRWKQIWHVTLPGIIPTIVVLLVMSIGKMLSVGYEKIILMYNPTIYETADVISTYVYRKGLLDADYGYSTAVSVFNSLCDCTLLFTANYFSKKISGEGLW